MVDIRLFITKKPITIYLYGVLAIASIIADINDKVTEELQSLKSSKVIRDWRSKVLGGGRIKHDPSAKTINVYGYSQGYGKADHQLSVDILKSQYLDYNVTWSDEGY